LTDSSLKDDFVKDPKIPRKSEIYIAISLTLPVNLILLHMSGIKRIKKNYWKWSHSWKVAIQNIYKWLVLRWSGPYLLHKKICVFIWQRDQLKCSRNYFSIRYWIDIFRDHDEFKLLAKFFIHLMLIPHSNTFVERTFSFVKLTKTPIRNGLGIPVVNDWWLLRIAMKTTLSPVKFIIISIK